MLIYSGVDCGGKGRRVVTVAVRQQTVTFFHVRVLNASLTLARGSAKNNVSGSLTHVRGGGGGSWWGEREMTGALEFGLHIMVYFPVGPGRGWGSGTAVHCWGEGARGGGVRGGSRPMILVGHAVLWSGDICLPPLFVGPEVRSGLGSAGRVAPWAAWDRVHSPVGPCAGSRHCCALQAAYCVWVTLGVWSESLQCLPLQ